MILVDTSVIVAWLDKQHAVHKACTAEWTSCLPRDNRLPIRGAEMTSCTPD